MIDSFLAFFKDTGNTSMIRLLTFILVISGVLLGSGLAIYDLIQNSGSNLINITILSTSFISLGLGGKVIQKNAESKIELQKGNNE